MPGHGVGHESYSAYGTSFTGKRCNKMLRKEIPADVPGYLPRWKISRNENYLPTAGVNLLASFVTLSA
jgi:hypothetical protein